MILPDYDGNKIYLSDDWLDIPNIRSIGTYWDREFKKNRVMIAYREEISRHTVKLSLLLPDGLSSLVEYIEKRMNELKGRIPLIVTPHTEETLNLKVSEPETSQHTEDR